MLKAGFIGAGGRGQSAHYPSVHRLADRVEMAAVCELDEERLNQVVAKYGFTRTYQDHRAMLDEIDPDIVYCVMNEKWLLQPALDCIAAGKHLFIEKPPGANSDETRAILEAAERQGVWVMVGLQRRYTAVTREAMRLVAAKGPVSLATTTFQQTASAERRRIHHDLVERSGPHRRSAALHGRWRASGSYGLPRQVRRRGLQPLYGAGAL